MGHTRSESQLPLYSSKTASSSSSSLSASSGSSELTTFEKQAYSDKKARHGQQHGQSHRKSKSRNEFSKLVSSFFALFPAAGSALYNIVLGAGRRRPLPLIIFCLTSIFILASFTTSDEYIPDSVSASRAKLSSFINDGFRITPIRLPKAPPSSDITLDNGKRSEQWISPTPALPITATLRERLQSLWDAPLSEPANWVKWNSETCSRDRVKQAQNDWITQDAALIWHSLNSTDIKKYRKGMIDYLVECEKQGLMDPANVGQGRG